MLAGLSWDEDDADYIRRRSDRYPGAVDIEPACTQRAVQLMAGHASAAMTLDICTGLLADDLTDVADRLDALVARVVS